MTRSESARARHLLQTLLPEARERMPHMKDGGFSSGLGRAMAAYVREDNLEGVRIYRAPLGGWIADVDLKRVPPGVSNCIGTPVGRPLASEAEARDQAVSLLALVLFLSQREAEKVPPVFNLYDWNFTLSADVLAALEAAGCEGYGDKDKSVQRLEEVLRTCFGGERPTKAMIDALPRDSMRLLMSVLHVVAMSGVMRHPAPEPAIID